MALAGLFTDPQAGQTVDQGGEHRQAASQCQGRAQAKAPRDTVISCHSAPGPGTAAPPLINSLGSESLIKGDYEPHAGVLSLGSFPGSGSSREGSTGANHGDLHPSQLSFRPLTLFLLKTYFFHLFICIYLKSRERQIFLPSTSCSCLKQPQQPDLGQAEPRMPLHIQTPFRSPVWVAGSRGC